MEAFNALTTQTQIDIIDGIITYLGSDLHKKDEVSAEYIIDTIITDSFYIEGPKNGVEWKEYCKITVFKTIEMIEQFEVYKGDFSLLSLINSLVYIATTQLVDDLFEYRTSTEYAVYKLMQQAVRIECPEIFNFCPN